MPPPPAPAGPSTSREIELPEIPSPPRPILTTQEAVDRWPTTPGFKAFWGWVQRRCTTLKGKEVQRGPYDGSSNAIRQLLSMLDQMSTWIEEVPPQSQANQRYGNLAFRAYIKLVDERLPAILESWNMPKHLYDQIVPLLIQSTAFGQPTRLDYGTGHELAFVFTLWCCVLSGWVGGSDGEEEEDDLILRVFTRYLDLMTQLQKTYRLEPAGSHGVWGLDDYCFLPYLFGSAQLLDGGINPTQALQNALGSTPTDSIKDLYTLSLRHLTLFKRGASFSEHSPLLYQLSQMPDWKKAHGGLRKMFLGEVIGKRVVVQGLWIGGWGWGTDMPQEFTNGGQNIPRAVDGRSTETRVAGTSAPWAR